MTILRFIGFVSVALLSLQSMAKTEKDVATRDFWLPKLHGLPLAYCNAENSLCGQKIADSYCQLMGYDSAKSQVRAPNRGLTQFLDTKSYCSWNCDAFKIIECNESMKHIPPKSYHYRKKRFAYPRANNYRLDWCYKANKECGKAAAQAFCYLQGYMYAQQFKEQGLIYATKTLLTEELCFGKHCKGFEYIVCAR